MSSLTPQEAATLLGVTVKTLHPKPYIDGRLMAKSNQLVPLAVIADLILLS
jgi:hypothetical protein